MKSDAPIVGGFAVVAYPAAYASTGAKTFIVKREGIFYQKDLGPGTAEVAKAMKVYNPEKTWEKAQ